ncbi:MAG: hypothetical protein ABSF64_36765 [Bryobacteraceae bacterium]
MPMKTPPHPGHCQPTGFPVSWPARITGETALRLARYFNTTPDYWINIQSQYELETARDEWEAKIQSKVRPRHAA